MSKIKVSELFYSLQGEGRFVGAPSIFLRTFGCNFTCSGFGMSPGEKSYERDHIQPYPGQKFEELPLVRTGCDSYASWDPRFKHLSPMLTVDAIVDRIMELLPNGYWSAEHLVITGGEPLLGWQRSFVDLLRHPKMEGLQYLTFETNGTQHLHDDLREYLILNSDLDVTFSISPKLSVSGEAREDAIRPDIVSEYQAMAEMHQTGPVENVYLKFVVDQTPGILDEIQSVIREYQLAGFMGHIYLMPVGGTTHSYEENLRPVAELALANGYRFSPRLHVTIWGNSWAT